MTSKLRSHRFWILWFISMIGLSLSFCAEFIWSFAPCLLCLTQRILYGLLAVFSFLGVLKHSKMASRGCLILLAVNFCVASYHTLVQLEIVTDRCRRTPRVENAAAYRNFLLENRPSCAEKQWTFEKIPIPALNGLVSLALLPLFYESIQMFFRRKIISNHFIKDLFQGSSFPPS